MKYAPGLRLPKLARRYCKKEATGLPTMLACETWNRAPETSRWKMRKQGCFLLSLFATVLGNYYLFNLIGFFSRTFFKYCSDLITASGDIKKYRLGYSWDWDRWESKAVLRIRSAPDIFCRIRPCIDLTLIIRSFQKFSPHKGFLDCRNKKCNKILSN